jgi:hypothetical protein
VHEIMALCQHAIFIDDSDRAIFMLLGGTFTDEHQPMSPTMRSTIIQEHGWRSVRDIIHGEVLLGVRVLASAALGFGGEW